MAHFLKFLGLIFIMYLASMIPFGAYLNTAIVVYSLWMLTK
jgi:high-affinity K+ transport system ATPase subunit B